jgi:hypothetical protein
MGKKACFWAFQGVWGWAAASFRFFCADCPPDMSREKHANRYDSGPEGLNFSMPPRQKPIPESTPECLNPWPTA